MFSGLRFAIGHFHWSVRIAQLALILALLVWQSRHTIYIHTPMYGWPMPFNNVWYEGVGEWRPSILLVNLVVWIALAASLGIVLQRYRQLRFGLIELLILQFCSAIMAGLGIFEFYLRQHPNNVSIFPKYAHLETGPIDLWLDIGLFTDPPNLWLIARIPIIISIGCAFFWTTSLLLSTIRRRDHVPPLESRGGTIVLTPMFVRFFSWLLIAMITFYSLLTLTPFMVH